MNLGIDSDNPAETAPAKLILPLDPLRNSRNFRLNDDVASHIAEGGPKARIQHNLDILELLKTIQGEQRTATPEEQNRIAQYIDFGGLRELWDQGYRYYEERNRLAEILTEEEIDAVKETSLNTHYTAIEIVDQMWEAANRLGFAGGRILEPGMGVGNFFARIPTEPQPEHPVWIDSLSHVVPGYGDSSAVNVPELQSIWSQFADVMMQDEAEEAGYITLPKAVRKDLLVKVTPAQEPLLQSIAERGELLSLPMSDPDRPDPTEDNWLKLDSDACAISLDARLYDPTCPDDPDSKANTAVRKTLDVLRRTEAERGTVIVFADRYQRGDFNLFADMKTKLIAAGVPREQIAIVHDYKKGREFFGLQQAMRAGRVRVLLGTTEKCGIGVNIQTRLKALIDLDLPQRPDQLEQRHGRMRRSGNTFSEVEFYRMISEPRDVASPKAHDLQRAQLLERKQTFLSQFKSGGRMGRKIEDIAGETRLSPQMFALAKAQATGNPLALEKIKLEYEIKNLTLLARSNRLDHYNNRQQLLNVEYRIAHLKDRLPQLQEANRVFKSHERRDDEGKLLSLQVRFNGLEFLRLKDANEYLRTVTLDSTTQLTVNGLDIPLAVSDALIKDELGAITDITAVRYNLAGEWFDVPRPEAHMGLPSAQSLLTSVLRRGGDLPAKILETEAAIQGNEATLAQLHTALDYQSPYEAKLKEYEQRLAEIDEELLGKTEEVEELVDAETEELQPSRVLSDNHESGRTQEPAHMETIEERSVDRPGIDDSLVSAPEFPVTPVPRFKPRQTADRGR